MWERTTKDIHLILLVFETPVSEKLPGSKPKLVIGTLNQTEFFLIFCYRTLKQMSGKLCRGLFILLSSFFFWFIFFSSLKVGSFQYCSCGDGWIALPCKKFLCFFTWAQNSHHKNICGKWIKGRMDINDKWRYT